MSAMPDEVILPSTDSTSMLKELLAIIHGDGGHHTAEVGLVQSVKDALTKIHSHQLSPDTDYTLESGSIWIGVKNLDVHITVTDEGVVSDTWAKLDVGVNGPIGSSYVFFSEGEPEDEGESDTEKGKKS